MIGDTQSSQLGCEKRQGRQRGRQSGRQGRGSSEAGRDQASRDVSGPIWGSEGGNKLQNPKALLQKSHGGGTFSEEVDWRSLGRLVYQDGAPDELMIWREVMYVWQNQWRLNQSRVVVKMVMSGSGGRRRGGG